ncbi:MAG: zinc ribbon domain-containing protein [Gemmatimonadota bacterium]
MSQLERDTLESVEKLLAERRKIAGWMSALDERRADTPPAVYQRVHEDYTVKLDKVQAKLLAASDAVRTAAADVAGRLLDKEQALATKQEERAEAELRAAVGEYSEREWEKRRTRLDDDIALATGERDALLEELARLRRVLGEAAGGAALEAPTPGDGGDLLAAPEEWLAVAGTEDAAAGDYSLPGEASTLAAGEAVSTASDHAIPIHEQTGIAAAEPAMPLEPSFDELAFLKTVVGRPTPLGAPRILADAPPPFAPQAPRTSAASYAVPEPPLEYPDAMPEPRVSQEMTPPRESFFGRPTPRSSEAIKSLKCAECGTLNFPTEWYCERCGGELAAM